MRLSSMFKLYVFLNVTISFLKNLEPRVITTSVDSLSSYFNPTIHKPATAGNKAWLLEEIISWAIHEFSRSRWNLSGIFRIGSRLSSPSVRKIFQSRLQLRQVSEVVVFIPKVGQIDGTATMSFMNFSPMSFVLKQWKILQIGLYLKFC